MNVQINNLNIAYDQRGSGRVVVLLHGWGSSKETFAGLALALQEKYTVITVDLPGFGDSEQPLEAWTVGDYAHFVQDFLQGIKVNNTYAFIAHSFGGRVCIKGIAGGTLHADKLVLIGAAGIKHGSSVRNTLFRVTAKLGKPLFLLPGLREYQQSVKERLYQQAGSADYLQAGTMRQIFINAINEDLTDSLSKIHTQTLLIWGSEDDQTPLADARIMNSHIQNSTLRIQQQAGHFVHTEYPQKAIGWVKDFFAMIVSLFLAYSPRLVISLTYMLQASDYRVKNYFRWLMRVRDIRGVMYRKKLQYTHKALALVAFGMSIYLAILIAAAMLLANGSWLIALTLVAFMPIIIALLLALASYIGYLLFQKPKEAAVFSETKNIIKHHPGVKIAIAGSYGKTTMKELLRTVLDSKLHVAATPGNMNTAAGISRFVKKLDGSEDVLIFELGEEKPGDVRRLCELVDPTYGIITGISEAHLDTFKSIDEIIKTIFELQAYVGVSNTYKNIESKYVAARSDLSDKLGYGKAGVNGWGVSKVKLSMENTEFIVAKGKDKVNVNVRLIGGHQVGPICACVDMARTLGMSPKEIENGLQQVVPFKHRMQPRYVDGALVIDDTYNGNIVGVESGLALLRRTVAKRKIYVTPGLVEQGSKTQEIHERMGELIAPVADVVVLMNNSTTRFIVAGLTRKQFKGDLKVIDDPLEFYENLQHFVVAGDAVLMQNDWTDNYA